MPAPSPEPLVKVTLRFFRDDYALIHALYGEGKTNEVLREVVRGFAERLRAREKAALTGRGARANVGPRPE